MTPTTLKLMYLPYLHAGKRLSPLSLFLFLRVWERKHTEVTICPSWSCLQFVHKTLPSTAISIYGTIVNFGKGTGSNLEWESTNQILPIFSQETYNRSYKRTKNFTDHNCFAVRRTDYVWKKIHKCTIYIRGVRRLFYRTS